MNCTYLAFVALGEGMRKAPEELSLACADVRANGMK